MKNVVVLAGGDGKRRLILRNKFGSHLYKVRYCKSLSIFMAIRKAKIAAILLLYPDEDGIIDKILRRNITREPSDRAAVVFISSSPAENNKLRSFAYRADEFLIEPVSTDELIRIINESIASFHEKDRGHNEQATADLGYLLTVGDLKLNKETRLVTWRARELPLYPLQVHILEFLMQNPGRPITRIELLNRVWNADIDVEDRTVDRNIKRIRDVFKRKAGFDPIRTIRHIGYEFDDHFEQRSSLPRGAVRSAYLI